jgi:hypothetical protein
VESKMKSREESVPEVRAGDLVVVETDKGSYVGVSTGEGVTRNPEPQIVKGVLVGGGVIVSARGRRQPFEKWFIDDGSGRLSSGPFPNGFPTREDALRYVREQRGGNAA